MSKVTKLQSEMYAAMQSIMDREKCADAAAEVAKRYIEKAFLEASHEIVGGMPKVQRYALEVWLKENGVI